jgi:hypothetical protein
VTYHIVVQFIQKPQVPVVVEEQVQEEPGGAHEATIDEDEEVNEERVPGLKALLMREREFHQSSNRWRGKMKRRSW